MITMKTGKLGEGMTLTTTTSKRPLKNTTPINRMKQRNAMVAKTCREELEAPLQKSENTDSEILGTIAVIALICAI